MAMSMLKQVISMMSPLSLSMTIGTTPISSSFFSVAEMPHASTYSSALVTT